jgi:hypothetical protein
MVVRNRWRSVNQFISAAQVFTHLGATSSLQKPEHETQVRPLLGLPPEQAKLAWDRALEAAGTRPVTARLVKAAVEEQRFGGEAELIVSPTRVVGPVTACSFGEFPTFRSHFSIAAPSCECFDQPTALHASFP